MLLGADLLVAPDELFENIHEQIHISQAETSKQVVKFVLMRKCVMYVFGCVCMHVCVRRN